MTTDRKNELKNCLKYLFLEQSKQKEQNEKTGCLLFFQYYFSVLYGESLQDNFSFSYLLERVEKGRFQWKFYKKWTGDFSDFLYLMTGREESRELFSLHETELSGDEQRAIGRFQRKVIKNLEELHLKKEEAGDYLVLFFRLYFKKEEEKDGLPVELARNLADLFIWEQEKRSDKPDPIVFGSGKGQLPIALKKAQSNITIKAKEADQKSDELAQMFYFAMEPDQRWVSFPDEKQIELGISLWPFGTSAEETGESFPASCIPGQKGNYKNLGKWLSDLSDTGVFYFLCPAGFLYREGREKSLRRYLIEEKNILDGILLLPDMLFHSGFPETVLLRFRMGRKEEETLYFIDASKEKETELEKIMMLFQTRQEKAGIACFVGQKQIREQGMNLNPARYFEASLQEDFDEIDIAVAKKRLTEIEERLSKIEEQRKMYLFELSLRFPSE